MRFRPAARGFSLIELLMVVAIVAVIGAIAVPRWWRATANYQLSMAAKRVCADLAMAQARANFGSTAVSVSFSPGTNSYQILGMPDPDRPTRTYTANLAADPYDAAITSATFGAGAGTSQVSFDAYGTPSQGGTVVLSAGGRQCTISLDATSGRTTVQ